ncbi:MAG: carboxylating nicotinate-nucleotide diphosphorylase [Pseudomonadota bacterium]|jgi:nicotinate-nucleotide pyrophosphorylase (carboxylating)|nr:carboxylating nicotinate-nucleotide diphosphorylase [Pseudomonadota bacterium]
MSKRHEPNLVKIEESVKLALEEDIGIGDITGELIDPLQTQSAILLCREKSILCGSKWFEASFKIVDPNANILWNIEEGALIEANTEVATIEGNAKCMVASERTGLNFLQMMSGIAYKTYCYNKKLEGSNTKLLDTRKTLPGLRYEQKYSVVIGGGQNHRMGLYDAALVKENHIASSGSIKKAVETLRNNEVKIIEVEVENLDELREAIDSGADIAMLDNFKQKDLVAAVEIAANKIKLEVSGNIDVYALSTIKELDIDYISSGDLTKNISATDYSLIFKSID